MLLRGANPAERGITLKRISQIAEALKTDVETLLNFDSKKHVIHIENNQGSIYTSINYGTVNTLDKDLIKILTSLNEEVMRLNRKFLEGK